MISAVRSHLVYAEDDAPGYMWGMNILTGRTREEDEADRLIARRGSEDGQEDGRRVKPRQMVQLR